MATRSTIAIKVLDQIFSIYCHWDGYPDHNGRILKESWTDEQKIVELMELGNISSLGKDIGEQHPFERGGNGWCTAYGRDRNEADQEHKVHQSIAEWKAERQNWGCEYGYLYYPESGKWKTFNL